VTVAKILKVKKEVVLSVLRGFKGLEHRLELVDKVDEVSFYNDSFATGPQPTIAAINSFSEPVTLILGGSDKGLNYDDLGKEITRSLNINAVILIGFVADQIKLSLIKAGYKNQLIEMGRSSMRQIVKKAKEITPQGGVVILSPAAASFDMFANYKDRGNQFKEAVVKLKK